MGGLGGTLESTEFVSFDCFHPCPHDYHQHQKKKKKSFQVTKRGSTLNSNLMGVRRGICHVDEHFPDTSWAFYNSSQF